MPVDVVHVLLAERGPRGAALRYWRDNPNDYISRDLATDEIADLVARAEADYYSVTEPELVAIGKRLYGWLDGSDRWLARELSARGGGPVALMIDAAGTLAHLPWEVLHDGTTFLVHGADPAVLPVRWRKDGPRAAAPRNRPLNVLFMATSPLGVQPELNYEEEEGRILEATRTYPLVLTVEETGSLAELGDLVKGYPDGHFDVLHLTGHADHRDGKAYFLAESRAGD